MIIVMISYDELTARRGQPSPLLVSQCQGLLHYRNLYLIANKKSTGN